MLGAQDSELHRRPEAKSASQAIYNAGSRTEALTAAKSFADAFSSFPKATAKIMGELDTLLAFCDFPEVHWVHLRTSNPLEPMFSTVKAEDQSHPRGWLTQGALAMAYKLLDAAQARWHNDSRLQSSSPLVPASATFIDGKLREGRLPETEPDVAETWPVAA